MPLGLKVPFQCVSLQSQLDNFFASNLLPNKRTKANAFLKFLNSQRNRAGITQIQQLAGGNGKKRTVKMQSRDAICFDLLKNSWTCEQAALAHTAAPKEHIFELDDTPYYLVDVNAPNVNDRQKPLIFTWDFTQWQKLCIDQPMFFMETIAMALADIDRLVNKDLMTQLSAKVGKHNIGANGTVKIDIPLFVPTSTSAIPQQNPFVDRELRKAYNLARISGDYAVLGGNRFWDYASVRGMADASQFGYNLAKTPQTYEFFYDLDSDDVIGAADFLTLPYGGVQLVQFHDYQGDGQIDYPDSKKMVVYTPNGLGVDMWWNHKTDGRCNEIQVGLSTYAELAVVPDGGCQIADGVNGIFRFTDCSVGSDVACP